MNKLFKKTLALLACIAVIGQTMLISVVSATEELLANDAETNVEQKALVSDTTEENTVNMSLVTDLNGVEISTETPEDVSTAEVKQLDGEVTTCENTMHEGMAVLKSVIENEISNNERAKELNLRVSTENDDTLVLTIDTDKTFPSLIGKITDLIDHLLGREGNTIWDELNRQWFNFNISAVTQLIDVNLALGRENIFDLSTTFKGCDFDFQLEIRVDDGSNSWNEGWVCDADTMSDGMSILESVILTEAAKDDIAKDLNLRVSTENDNVLVLTVDNDKSFPSLIGKTTELIDHILGYEGDTIWDELNSQWFNFNISDVTQLIDVNLTLGSKNIFDLSTTFKGCEFDFQLEIRVNDSSNSWNEGWVCDDGTMKDGMAVLETIVNGEIVNSKISKAFVENNKLVLLIDDEKNFPSLLTKITQLIDHLLGYENDTMWDKLESQWFYFSIDSLTQLINVNLSIGTERIFNLHTTFNNCRFDFQLEIRVDDNSNNWNGGNSWHSWWSSSGGWTKTSSTVDNEEIEFGWEVVEPEDNDSSKCSIEWSTYSDEENQAYLWACEKWIVPANNIMKSNLSSPLTRAELDKMMSIYSKQLLWRTYVVNETVSYPDVDSRLGNLVYYIQEWYKLQIMGIHANGVALNNFLPNLLVTRWEFGTVFSRVLYWNKYNIDGANYYERHLQVLKDAGILTNTNPTLMEARGWVLLMLYRSQKVEESNWAISNEEIASITAEEENVEVTEETTTATTEATVEETTTTETTEVA